MRHSLLVLPLLLGSALLAGAAPARAELNIGITIGVDMPQYPQLVLIPGYPVYYDPSVDANYFFYDGSYWVLDDDEWYASNWYDGPWEPVDAFDVPLFLLRVPVAYYRAPPRYFQGWRRDAPPRWGQHWGPQWQERRGRWDRWNRRDAPKPAPLPTYQRNYSGARYPHAPQQQNVIRQERYHYRPHEAASRRVAAPPAAAAGATPEQRRRNLGWHPISRPDRSAPVRSPERSPERIENAAPARERGERPQSAPDRVYSQPAPATAAPQNRHERATPPPPQARIQQARPPERHAAPPHEQGRPEGAQQPHPEGNRGHPGRPEAAPSGAPHAELQQGGHGNPPPNKREYGPDYGRDNGHNNGRDNGR